MAVPPVVQEMAFVRAGTHLYIEGGKTVVNNQELTVSDQLFALDLAKSWSVNSPPWKRLKNGPRLNLHYGIAMPNNETLITFFNTQSGLVCDRYNVLQDIWHSSLLITIGETFGAMRSVVDPSTGLVYINGVDMNIYNPNNNTLWNSIIPTDAFRSRYFGGAVYNSARKTIMYLGGFYDTGQGLGYEAQTYITEYEFATGRWLNFDTNGDLPMPRADHCMAASEDGSTVVVFGGRVPPDNFTGTFHILDVSSQTWRRGPDSGFRLYMACIIVGNQFLAWGGYDGTNSISGPPIVFDFGRDQWVNTYTAPEYYLNTPSLTAPTNGGDKPLSAPSVPTITDGPSLPNMGAILGGSLGVLLVIALSAAMYLVLKRRADRTAYESLALQRLAEGSDNGAKNAQTSASSSHPPNNPQFRTPQIPGTEELITGGNPQDSMAMELHHGRRSIRSPQLLYSSDGKVPLAPSPVLTLQTTTPSLSSITYSTPMTITPTMSSPITSSANPSIFGSDTTIVIDPRSYHGASSYSKFTTPNM
ncbi:hypothetical protein BG011_003239 [Mortierella polycephala]|uniref:Galactose oxidase n=1 Tax=Mortierella polycephala TaxID=41804 RepID=A0A9P6Q3G9_9FUNG|nr:hypothetical protein BG011_003239 [Mortierella polycephala]